MTYNHEKFIHTAIDSILMQKTNFTFEIVVGDDCSTDKTQEILLNYKKNNPNTFKLIFNEKNLGAKVNQVNVLTACSGKYIAICEGDDHWTDSYKLQKQVDFLENNSEYVMCSHDIITSDDNNTITNHDLLPVEFRRDFTANELIKAPWIPSLTRCFKNIFLETPNLLNLFYAAPNGDQLLSALLGQYGGNKYLGREIKPASYRRHSGGVWSSKSNIERIKLSSITNKVIADFFQEKGNIEVSNYYLILINKNLSSLTNDCIKSQNTNKLIEVKDLIKEFYTKQLNLNEYNKLLITINKKIVERIVTYPYYKIKNSWKK